MKARILSIIATPPPVHGSAVMNNYVRKSNILNSSFQMNYINYNFVNKVSDIGTINCYKIYRYLLYLFQVLRAMIFLRPHLVYFPIVPNGVAFYRDSLIVLLVKLFNVPIILHLHGKGAKDNYSSAKFLYNLVYNGSHIVCLSNRLLEDVHFAKGNFYIVPNGIEQTMFEAKSEFGDDVMLLFLSNLLPSKGIIELLDAIKIVHSKKINGWSLNIVGSFTNEITQELLENYVLESGLENVVKILGPKFGDDKDTVLRNSDVFCFPTRHETFGLVNLEAMQHSLPIISSYEGAIPDLIQDGINGFLVDPENKELLADYIIRLIEDKPLRVRMAKNSFAAYTDRYTLQRFEQNICGVFREVIGRENLE